MAYEVIIETKAQKEIFRRNQTRIARITADLREGMALDHVAEKIEETSVKLLELLEKDSEITDIIDDLESVAKGIEEESQRRSMVVT